MLYRTFVRVAQLVESRFTGTKYISITVPC